MKNGPTRKVLAALGKVWAAEISNSLPFQSKAKIYGELCESGLLAPMERMFGKGVWAVKVHGYQLTHAGRLAYCASCGGGK